MSVRYAKPAILDRLGAGHGVIEASAGTGKTYTLEHLVVDFILQGVAMEKILVVTFTVKATLELKARVRAKLEELAALDQDQGDPGASCWVLDEPARTALQVALASFDRATISTIHGFCQQVLQDSAFESGRLFTQESVAVEAAFDRVFKQLVRTRWALGPQRPLFEQALDRLNGLEGLARFLAEAMKEAAHLDLPDLGGLAVAVARFPRSPAQALLTELNQYQADKARGPLLQALAAVKVTAQSYGKLGRLLGAVLCGQAEVQAGAAAGSFWAWTTGPDLRYLAEQFQRQPERAELQELAAGCAELAGQAVDFRAVLAAEFLPALVQALDAYKAEEGLFDFNDMIALVHQAVLADSGEALVQRLRERFQVALIDEFQDTDGCQWDLFRRLFLDSPEHRLILVGDPKQAIYGFRSGDLPTYLEAVRAVQARSGRPEEKLETNFRSTPELINAYCEVFRGSPEAPFFTGRNQVLGQGVVHCGKPGLALVDAAGAALPAIRVVEVAAGPAEATRSQLAASLAWAIRTTLSGEPAWFGARPEPTRVRPEDIFVLTSTAREGLEMARALRAVAVPVAFFKQEGLFSGDEAKALRDLLLAVNHPLQENLRAKALLGPFFGLSFQEVEASRTLSEGHPILKRLFTWRDLALAGRFAECFASLISVSGITQRLLFLEEGERTLTNLQHLLELLLAESQARHATLMDLAVLLQRWIAGSERPSVEDGDVQRLERTGGAVQILTMHKSKGLEAPIVALFGGFAAGGKRAAVHRYHDHQDRRRAFIGSQAAAPDLAAQEAQEEGERLLYVALTRAKAQLILPRIVLGPVPPAGNSVFDPATGDPKGPYGCVNRRLRAMLLAAEGGLPAGFRRDSMPEAEGPVLADPAARLAQWQPKLPAGLDRPDFLTLARHGRPLWSYSYTSLAHGLKRFPASQESWEERSEPERAEPEARSGTGPAGGARLGTLVHRFLEQVPLASFQAADSEAWLAAPGIQDLLQPFSATDRPAVGLWAYQAFTGELALPGGASVRLADAEAMLRELDFLTPYPGGGDLLTGSMDVLFQAGGLAYVLDWKTNRLAEYGSEALAAVVAEDYLLQVKAYTVTACRFLELVDEAGYQARFGGILYVFLRGLPGAGLWSLRPSWTEVQAWERELAQLPVATLIPVQAGGSRHA